MPSTTRRQVLQAGIGAAALSLGPRGPGLPTANAQSAIGTLRLSDQLHVLTVGGNNVVTQIGRAHV